jgi:HAD superfamily hydrolase (TIGR01509 family)
MTGLNTELLAVIDNLKKQYTVSLLSDTLDVHIKYFQEVGVFEHFDHTFLSPQIGLSKKSGLKIFNYVAAQLKAAPASILFVDDLPINVSSAITAGWQAIQYTNNFNLKKQLLELGIKY